MYDEKIVSKDGAFLFNSVFPDQITESNFYNKHFNNPYRISEPVKIVYEDGKPIGMNSFMGMLIRDNISGEEYIISQSNDTAVLLSHRGKHIFSNIVNSFEEEDTESNYTIGIPNQNSYPGFIKMGWKEAAELRILRKKHSRLALLKSYSAPDVGGLNSRWYRQVQLSDIELDIINNSCELLAKKTNEYINWKLSNCDGYMYLKRDNDGLAGYMAIHLAKGKKYGLNYNDLYIDDWYYKNTKELKEMICEADYYGYRIIVPFVNRNNKEYFDFIECGLIDNKENASSYMLISPRGSNRSLKSFSFRNIDGDCILNGNV